MLLENISVKDIIRMREKIVEETEKYFQNNNNNKVEKFL